MRKLFVFIIMISLVVITINSNEAYAKDPKVKVMFLDTVYGAAIGATIAGVVILNDNDDWKKKLSLGLTLGAVGGLIFGIVDSFDLMARDASLPTPIPTKPLLALKKLPNGQIDTVVHLDLMSVYF